MPSRNNTTGSRQRGFRPELTVPSLSLLLGGLAGVALYASGVTEPDQSQQANLYSSSGKTPAPYNSSALSKFGSKAMRQDLEDVLTLTQAEIASMSPKQVQSTGMKVQTIALTLHEATGISAEGFEDALITPATENALAERGVTFEPSEGPCLNATIVPTKAGLHANFPLSQS